MTTIQRNYWLAWSASLLFFVAFYTLLTPFPLYLLAVELADWQISLIMGAFGVASLIGRPLAGLGADHFGYRPVMLMGALLLLMGVAGVTATANPLLLLALRLLQAAGYVAFTTSSNALAVSLAEPNRRKSALTRFGAAANVSMTLTPATISALLPCLTLVGALWVAAGFGLLSALLSLAIQPAAPGPIKTAVARSPWLMPRSVFLPISLAAISGVAFGAFLQFLPLLTARRGDISSGPIFAAYGAGIALTRLLIARWVDQIDQRRILQIGYLLLALGLGLFAFSHSWLLFVAAALSIAAGAGLQTGLLMNLHVDALPAQLRGSGVAFYYLGFDLGIGGGAWLAAPMIELFGIGGLYAWAAVMAGVGAILVRRVVSRPGTTDD
jgi:MFS family permease